MWRGAAGSGSIFWRRRWTSFPPSPPDVNQQSLGRHRLTASCHQELKQAQFERGQPRGRAIAHRGQAAFEVEA